MVDRANRTDLRDLLELAKRRVYDRLENDDAKASDINAATALLKASMDLEDRLDERERMDAHGGHRAPRPGSLSS